MLVDEATFAAMGSAGVVMEWRSDEESGERFALGRHWRWKQATS